MIMFVSFSIRNPDTFGRLHSTMSLCKCVRKAWIDCAREECIVQNVVLLYISRILYDNNMIHGAIRHYGYIMLQIHVRSSVRRLKYCGAGGVTNGSSIPTESSFASYASEHRAGMRAKYYASYKDNNSSGKRISLSCHSCLRRINAYSTAVGEDRVSDRRTGAME